MASYQVILDAKCVERAAIAKTAQLERKVAKKRLVANVAVGLARVVSKYMCAHIASFLRIPISAQAAIKMVNVNKNYRTTHLVQAAITANTSVEESNEFLRKHVEQRLIGLSKSEQKDYIRYLPIDRLKDLCWGRGKKVSGKKSVLVERLLLPKI
jgi:hypothetical protein